MRERARRRKGQGLRCMCSSNRKKLDGIHEGKNAGRTCWVVAGTLCKGEVQGSFAQKYKNCEKCEFYQEVRKEEAGKFMLSAVLLNKLIKPKD